MNKKIHIGHTLGFNSLTTALAAGGFAYVQEKFGRQDLFLEKVAFIILLGIFAYSFVKGILVAGKAADFDDNVKETDDSVFKKLGRQHTFSLLGGLLVVGLWFVVLEFQPRAGPPARTCKSTLALADGTTLTIEHDCDAVISGANDA